MKMNLNIYIHFAGDSTFAGGAFKSKGRCRLPGGRVSTFYVLIERKCMIDYVILFLVESRT
jgi:hypothetical protein